jgi:small subunit ribosomal protein S21
VFEGVAEVKVQDGESVESALRRFKRKVQQEEIIKERSRERGITRDQ